VRAGTVSRSGCGCSPIAPDNGSVRADSLLHKVCRGCVGKVAYEHEWQADKQENAANCAEDEYARLPHDSILLMKNSSYLYLYLFTRRMDEKFLEHQIPQLPLLIIKASSISRSFASR
jgi:hypothetical protein